MSNREAGKGCKPRPFSVSQHEYDNRWDAIFGRDKQKNDEKVKDEGSSNNTDNRKSKTK
jgi:hypothetical protein